MTFAPRTPPKGTDFLDVPDPIVGGDAELQALSFPSNSAKVGPSRAELRRRFRFSLAFCAFWMAAQLLGFGLRKNFTEMPVAYLAPLVALPFAAALLSLALSRAPGRLGLGLRGSSLAMGGALALATPVALGFLLSPPVEMVGSAKNHVTCVLLTLAWSLPPLFSLAYVMRHSFVAQAGLRSAHIAAAAGLLAATLSNLHCALVESAHVALAHGLPVTALAALGALFVAPRSRS